MSDTCRHCGVPIYREKGGAVRVVMHVEADCEKRRWQEPCDACGEPVTMSAARYHTGSGRMHDGCAGFPFCNCDVRHKGECTEATMAARLRISVAGMTFDAEPTSGERFSVGPKR